MPAFHRELAHAKLTRSLRIVGRRDDGFHLLEAEMVSLDIGDELEIGDGDGLKVTDAIAWSGPALEPLAAEQPVTFAVPTGPDNLVGRALAQVGRVAQVHLIKRIPAGAGLGGGSSDAAAILRWAGAFDSVEASRLGADVPFCLRGGRALVTGIGERLEPLEHREETYVVVSPPFGVSTVLVYRAYDELGPGKGEELGNDLELAACTVEPRLKRWKHFLLEVAGVPPLLAGSGSSWFLPCPRSDGERLVGELEGALHEARERAAITLCRTVDQGG